MNWSIRKTRSRGGGESLSERKNQSLSDLQKKKSRRKKIFWAVLWFLFIFTGACLLVHGLIWSSWFQIKEVNYFGVDRSNEEEIMNYLVSDIAGGSWLQRVLSFKHILAWPAHESWQRPVFLPIISKIELERNFWDRSLNVTVSEWQPLGIWCSTGGDKEKCGWFNSDGLVIQKAPLAEGSLIPVVRDVSGKELKLGKKILESEEKTANLLSVFKVLFAEHIPITEVRLERSATDEIKVFQTNGPEMYFSLRFPANLTQGPIHALRAEGWENLTYLDFRIENRVYYK